MSDKCNEIMNSLTIKRPLYRLKSCAEKHAIERNTIRKEKHKVLEKENEKLFITENKLLNQKNAFPPFSFVVIASVVR